MIKEQGRNQWTAQNGGHAPFNVFVNGVLRTDEEGDAFMSIKNDQFLVAQLERLARDMGNRFDRRMCMGSWRNVYLAVSPCGQQENIRREIRRRRSEGESYRAIAMALNRRGDRGPNGGRWYEASVRAVVMTSE